MTFGERLTHLRKEKGYTTRSELAEALGIPTTTLRNYETDVREPGHSFLVRVADLFGVTIDYLLGISEEHEKKFQFDITNSEMEHVKSYRELDAYGKETVDFILGRKLSRVKQLKEASSSSVSVPMRIVRYYQRLASAGSGEIVFDDLPVEQIEIPDTPKYRRVSYVIGVNGNSMEPLYYDGDLLLIEPTCQILRYLANLNPEDQMLSEHQKYADTPTFAELYDLWKSHRRKLKSAPTAGCWKNYDISFNRFSSLHHLKVTSIRAMDLQRCLTENSTKSRTTIGNMRAIIRGMWAYAMNNEIVTTNPALNLSFDFTESLKPAHARFTDEEILALWDALYVVNNVDIILIYIYTGMRPVELLDIESCNVHLEERYMIGGCKTEAGKDRRIPIHERIVPLIERRLADNRKYLISNKYGNHYTCAVYHNSNWNTVMQKLHMNHAPHDTRYTFASLADNAGMNETCRKIIMGHSLSNAAGPAFKTGGRSDVTRDVYTEKTLAEPLKEINKI